MENKFPAAKGYLISAGALLLAILFSFALKPFIHETTTLFFLAAVIISARWGNMRTAVLTIILSVLALDYLFIKPVYTVRLAWDDLPIITTFVLVALLISSVNEASQRARAALARANEELEEKVEARTRELLIAHDEEQKARAEAEAANREKDVFLAMVSHELRTPLNAILGWSQMLGRELTNIEQAAGLKAIERNAQTQAKLINDLLDAARIMNGKLQLEMRPVNLAALVQEVATEMQPAVAAKAIRIETALDNVKDNCLIDSDRMRQILNNLLSNAIKFTPAGGTIRIVLVQHEDDVHITVSDTGKGISAEFLPHVFERFRQRDHADHKAGGLGLGLAIVHHLVALHDGTIDVESQGEGQGTTFTIRLPLKKAASVFSS